MHGENMGGKNTKIRILDAALELISKDGLKATTTKAIAEKASVNEVTLFRHFESKEKLFLAVIDREAMVRFEIIQHDIEPSGDLVEELTMIGNFMSKAMVGKANFFKLMVMEVNRYPEIFDHIGTVPMAAIDMLKKYFDKAKEMGIVRKDVHSEIMAITYFSYLFRILVTTAFLGDDIFMKNRTGDGMRQFAEIFVNGVASRGD